MTTHVFIVDENTFPIHLEYMFAGTGAQEKEQHISLLADIKRVRPNDKVIFYLLKVGFYGIFKIKNFDPLVFHHPDYLIDKLNKKLIYRTLIEPLEVYELPVNEWIALDSLPSNPKDILWSLIYRKLRGNRGCTPITPEESDRLIDLIKKANNGKFLNFISYSWDNETQKIVRCKDKSEYNITKARKIEVFPFLKEKILENHAFEVELQAYFMENAGNDKLKEIIGNKNEIIWLGNEVACGIGMQKIDVFSIVQKLTGKEFRIIELKDEIVKLNIVSQLERYIKWVKDYLHGTTNKNIQPIVVSKKIKRISEINRRELKYSFTNFNKLGISLNLKYFEYELIDNDLIFQEIDYNKWI